MNGIVAACQGRLAKDLEPIRFTSSGTPFISFSLAVQDDKRGEDTPTQWIRATAWNDVAEHLAERGLPKGTELYVEGRLTLGEWTAQSGERRSGLNLSCWTAQPIGQIGRRQPRQQGEPSRRRDEPARTPAAAGGWAGAGRGPWGGAA